MTTWNLFKEMEKLQREVEEVFNGVGFNNLLRSGFLSEIASRRYPRVNLGEDKDNFYVEVLIPGVDPAELDMTINKGTLTIAGERKAVESGQEGNAWHRKERVTGKFLRTVEIPVDFDADNVKAEYKYGLLLVTLPKAEAAKPRKIAVEVA